MESSGAFDLFLILPTWVTQQSRPTKSQESNSFSLSSTCNGYTPKHSCFVVVSAHRVSSQINPRWTYTGIYGQCARRRQYARYSWLGLLARKHNCSVAALSEAWRRIKVPQLLQTPVIIIRAEPSTWLCMWRNGSWNLAWSGTSWRSVLVRKRRRPNAAATTDCTSIRLQCDTLRPFDDQRHDQAAALRPSIKKLITYLNK